MAGVFPSEGSIYIEAADALASALASSDAIKGEITNISINGGEQDVETVHAIGGDIDKEMPRSQFEVSFDVVIQNTSVATLDRWDIFKYGSGLTSATEGDNKAIFLDFATGSFNKVVAMNNCRSVTWEPELAADDMFKGSMTFKFSPLTGAGLANLKTQSVDSSASYTINWT